MADVRFEHVACNLCGSDDYKVLYPSTLTAEDLQDSPLHYSISQKSPRCGQIVRCRKCSLVYINPREKARDILRNYSLVRDEAYMAEEKARRKTFLGGLRLLENYCPGKGSLLDVGCFTGLFLDAAKKSGWSVRGIEPSEWAARYAREQFGLDVAQGAFEDKAPGLRDGSFDAVTMWDVIEHLTDPKAALAAAHKKLKARGILFLNTFDYGSIFRKMFGKKYWFIERMHIYYFTAATIKTMLRDCNYEVLRVAPHFKTLSLRYSIRRLADTNAALAAAMAGLSSALFLGKSSITAYAGQMSIIARTRT